MKLKLKTEGLEGDNLKFVEQLNAKFAELPDGLSKEDIQAAIKSEFKDFYNGEGKLVILDDIKALQGEFDEEKEGSIKDILKKQGVILTELKNKVNAGKAREKSLMEMLKEKTDRFKEIARNKSGHVILELKAAAVTTISGNLDSGTTGSITNSISDATAFRLGDGPVFEQTRGPVLALSFVNVGSTDASVLIWWDENSKEGDFAITDEGSAKPMLQYKFERKSSDYKKAAGYTVITDEFWNDFPQLVTTIRRLMNIDLSQDMDDQIMTDLLAKAPSYTITSFDDKFDAPDNYAAIAAAICQVQSLYYNPNTLVVNPVDRWMLRLEKDDNGRYQMPPIEFNGNRYEFGQVITHPGITAGKFLVGDGRMFNVDMKGGMIIRVGYNDQDFIKNQQTIIVEQYFYDYISSNRTGAFVYGDFATIKAALLKPAA